MLKGTHNLFGWEMMFWERTTKSVSKRIVDALEGPRFSQKGKPKYTSLFMQFSMLFISMTIFFKK